MNSSAFMISAEKISITIKGEQLDLDASGAVYWEAQKALLIADVHLGKIEHFRKNGSPLPAILGKKNYVQLDRVIEKYLPSKVYFLGDLFHSELNSEWMRFENWVKRQSTELVLIKGNHDIIHAQAFEKLGIQLFNELKINPFLLNHEPTENKAFVICGHVHPGFRLRGKGKQYLQLPCFYQQKNQLILPAFGAFTGHHYIQPEEGEQVYLVAQNKLFSLEG